VALVALLAAKTVNLFFEAAIAPAPSAPTGRGAARVAQAEAPAALDLAKLCHLLTVAAFALLGVVMGLGWPYWAGVLVVAALLIYEHSLVSPQDLSRLDVAFFNVNGYIAVILLAAVIAGRWI